MPVATAGLYLVDLEQNYGGVECHNIFWYLHSSGSDDAAGALFSGFQSEVLPLIADIQISQVTYTALRVRPIFGTGIEVTAVPTPSQGAITSSSDILPQFICASIRLNRATRETRSGWKRFTGLEEAEISGLNFVTAYKDLLDDLALVLDNDLGIANEFQPVLVRKPGTYADGVLTDYITNAIASADALSRVTTQNTRKTF